MVCRVGGYATNGEGGLWHARWDTSRVLVLMALRSRYVLVCVFHPFYRISLDLPQPYHEFQLPSCTAPILCRCVPRVRPFKYRPLCCLFPRRFLRLCFSLWARPSCRFFSDTHINKPQHRSYMYTDHSNTLNVNTHKGFLART